MSAPAPPRRSWLQFSLRRLLLAMLFVGVAIVIYRWPWEDERLETPYQTGLASSELGFDDSEVEFYEGQWKTSFGQPRGYLPLLIPPYPEPPPEVTRTTTYRRNWRGAPVKDGPETIKRKDGLVIGHRWYDEGDLRRVTLLYPSGEVLRAEALRGGVADGPFEFREPVRSLRGNYRQGKKSGDWECQYTARGETSTVKQSYADDLPHGEWRWLDAAGVSLQSATFDRGELIHWNGRPWREELADWQQGNALDPVTTQLMDAKISEIRFYEQYGSNDFLAVCQPISSDLPNMLLYSPQRRSGDGFSFFNYKELPAADEAPPPVWDSLLCFAFKNSPMPVYRFGVLGFVPISHREVQWRDTTGVMQVKFDEGSLEQSSWEEPVRANIPFGFDPDWFQYLFADTTIQFDDREFQPVSNVGEPRHLTSRLLPRRDLLGVVLYSQGYSCEQRGDVLVILPRPQD